MPLTKFYNMKSLSSIGFAILIVSFFWGCDENQPVNCFLGDTSAENNSPVLSGSSITLSSSYGSGIENIVFEWSGPNGFTSSESNPVISNASVDDAGEYSLKITRGICETNVATTEVQVIQNTVNCNILNNRATFTGFFPNANFFDFQESSPNGNKRFSAGDVNWRIEVVFLGEENPITGIYSISNINNPLTATTVRVTATYLGTNSTFNAKSGDLSIQYTNAGKAIIKFCAIPFSLNNQSSTDFNCTSLFTMD